MFIFFAFFIPFVILLGGFVLVDFLSAKPYRWLCHGRQFLNALLMATERGQPCEEALIRLADHGEADMGLHFQLLACWLREGLPLHEALERVPRFLPRPIEMLVNYGSRTGTLRDILPVGQRTMQELANKSANQQHDAIGIITVAFVLIGISSILFTFVIPKFIAIAMDMGGPDPTVILFLDRYYSEILILHQCVIALMVISYVFAFSGPASQIWISTRLPWVADWVHQRISWQWMRCRQRFGLMLAQLLDIGVPEDRALLLAGEYAGNRHFNKLVLQALTDLRNGTGLPNALQHLDLDGDFRFRMKAAAESGRPFNEALSDWFDAHLAKTEFRERAATDIANTVFTCYNAVIIALIAIGFFQFQIGLMNGIVPW